MKQLTFEQLQKFASTLDGYCLELNGKRAIWQCKFGHKWEAHYGGRIRHWCSICSKNKKLTLDDAKTLAIKNNGECLSDVYENSTKKLIWKCEFGHIWKTTYSSINSGSWCAKCKGYKKLTLEEIKKCAKLMGGKCLSESYTNSEYKLLWECKFGHRWESLYHNVAKGHWCPECAGQKKLTIEIANDIAKTRGGSCLSEIYINARIKLRWKCKQHHEWEMPIFVVKKGGWCPVCSQSKSESICREYMETLFGAKFVKCRPDWLRNNEGYNLELDGYCEELKIAFEHNGDQHYEITRFTKTDEQLLKIKNNDKIKTDLCEKHGIKLIIIPQLFSKIKLNKLKEFIKNESIKLGIIIPNNFDNISVDLNTYFKNADGNNTENKRPKFEAAMKYNLNFAQELAVKKGGECLSDFYVYSAKKMKWKCNNHNFVWESRFDHVLRSTWCPKCARETWLKQVTGKKYKQKVK